MRVVIHGWGFFVRRVRRRFQAQDSNGSTRALNSGRTAELSAPASSVGMSIPQIPAQGFPPGRRKAEHLMSHPRGFFVGCRFQAHVLAVVTGSQCRAAPLARQGHWTVAERQSRLRQHPVWSATSRDKENNILDQPVYPTTKKIHQRWCPVVVNILKALLRSKR